MNKKRIVLAGLATAFVLWKTVVAGSWLLQLAFCSDDEMQRVWAPDGRSVVRSSLRICPLDYSDHADLRVAGQPGEVRLVSGRADIAFAWAGPRELWVTLSNHHYSREQIARDVVRRVGDVRIRYADGPTGEIPPPTQ